MRQLALIAMLLGLASCALGPSRPAIGTVQRDCEDAADQDPAVRSAYVLAADSDPFSDLHRDYRRIRSESVNACLHTRGALPHGGVQKPL